MNNDQIIIYQNPGNSTNIEVQLKDESVWLNQRQMSELFQKDSDTIGLHIRNIYNEGELEEKSTTEESSVVQEEGKRKVTRKVKKYNLDVIISVGYRVKSPGGTKFRIWANKVLKDYLVKGYAINEQKLKDQAEKFNELKQTVTLLSNVLRNKELSSEEATGLLNVITDYSYALDILDQYDHQALVLEGTTDQQLFVATYAEAMQAIKDLKDKFGGSTLFGNEKDDSFKGSIGTIYQSFSGVEFYPTIEEKAANLLYFVVKNHSFSDGNKRIAAYLFVWFLERNRVLYRVDGTKRIADNALVALTLMIAESKPEEKDIMVKVVVNLINSKN
ncbi:virulence protein RhuM/Fic/DOC family protein [Mucilaginibacter sp.]|uniref:virulence protein RhuM/Fic/DOC family protein n=1 Tax=Mucilaginibacter sp. TaxID=1882438 RepID=UPI0025FAFC91|nr:virulence protein RhuM/Fic/DOC family protein [Mucilaginibacter sp.]